MASGCNSLQFSQKFEKLKAPNLSSDLDGVIYICEAWRVKSTPPACVTLKVQVAALGKYTANVEGEKVQMHKYASHPCHVLYL